ncbi:hypothetical protein H5410_021851 [Solanum commersonii]|uniref:Uncharacterized protein n=1 Tax=Solanum commersonii TaxID=4109 RepID=A0A9J5ZD51_SOLCO|nr:hypothetical protein H5410_021851 [Solanum commersonii]
MYLSIVSIQYPSSCFIIDFLQIWELPHEFMIVDLECYLLDCFVINIESLYFFLVLATLDEFYIKLNSATKSLNINLWGILSVNHGLWCHIPFCSPYKSMSFVHALFQCHGKPKISNLGSFVPFHKENIARLDVATIGKASSRSILEQ